jgi:ATPase subunit of ABC transporter with duplicated ATPase domains
MQYLLLENVSRSYGDKVLFNNVNLSISKGDKIALVAKMEAAKRHCSKSSAEKKVPTVKTPI